jgi:hypothetical protein
VQCIVHASMRPVSYRACACMAQEHCVNQSCRGRCVGAAVQRSIRSVIKLCCIVYAVHCPPYRSEVAQRSGGGQGGWYVPLPPSHSFWVIHVSFEMWGNVAGGLGWAGLPLQSVVVAKDQRG